jgi:hypothetical protein
MLQIANIMLIIKDIVTSSITAMNSIDHQVAELDPRTVASETSRKENGNEFMIGDMVEG